MVFTMAKIGLLQVIFSDCIHCLSSSLEVMFVPEAGFPGESFVASGNKKTNIKGNKTNIFVKRMGLFINNTVFKGDE